MAETVDIVERVRNRDTSILRWTGYDFEQDPSPLPGLWKLSRSHHKATRILNNWLRHLAYGIDISLHDAPAGDLDNEPGDTELFSPRIRMFPSITREIQQWKLYERAGAIRRITDVVQRAYPGVAEVRFAIADGTSPEDGFYRIVTIDGLQGHIERNGEQLTQELPIPMILLAWGESLPAFLPKSSAPILYKGRKTPV